MKIIALSDSPGCVKIKGKDPCNKHSAGNTETSWFMLIILIFMCLSFCTSVWKIRGLIELFASATSKREPSCHWPPSECGLHWFIRNISMHRRVRKCKPFTCCWENDLHCSVPHNYWILSISPDGLGFYTFPKWPGIITAKFLYQ